MNLKEVKNEEVLLSFYYDILPIFLDKIYEIDGETVKLDPIFLITQVFKNYEAMTKIIGKNAKILKIFAQLTNLKCIKEDPPITKKAIFKDGNGFETIKIKENFTLYRASEWFYETEQKGGHNSYYPDIQTATFFSMLLMGGVNAYKTEKEIKLFFLDSKDNIKKIIEQFLDPLIKPSSNSKNIEFYKFMKELISFKFDLENKPTTERIKEIKKRFGIKLLTIGNSSEHEVSFPSIFCGNGVVSTTVYRKEDDAVISRFLGYIIKILGYDGTYSHQQNNIYSWVGQRHSEITLNIEIKRDTTNSYDWTKWNIDDDFLLPAHEFIFNYRHFGNKNYNYNIYHFYKKMLENNSPTGEFDFATLNVHLFSSINLKHSEETAMEAVFAVMEKYQLKFICLQEVAVRHHSALNKIAERKGLFTSIGSFEKENFSNSSYHNMVISTAKIDIISNKMLPRKGHYIVFTHPHFSKKTFLTTQLTGSMDDQKSDIILGSLNISNNDFADYSRNNIHIESTTPDGRQSDYIMSKLPLIVYCLAVNYKYSSHRLVLGKI